MKLIVERAALLRALTHVQSVVERRTTIPILSNVLLRAETGRLALSATDMDLEIIERVSVQIDREGRTTAPAHTLYDIVRKLREGAQVEIKASGERNAMVLRSGRSTFTLQCLPPEDYPIMTSGELPHNFALPASELRTLIDRTRFAISTEETRYYLNGIYLHATKNDEVPVIRAVATDGHRLARVEMVLPEGAAIERVSTISTEKSRAVKLAIENGSLVVSATSPENGTAVEELDGVRYSASPLEIGFNSRYLTDIAEQIKGEGAQFVMSDAGSPTIVRDSADPSALYVLMPMRV